MARRPAHPAVTAGSRFHYATEVLRSRSRKQSNPETRPKVVIETRSLCSGGGLLPSGALHLGRLVTRPPLRPRAGPAAVRDFARDSDRRIGFIEFGGHGGGYRSTGSRAVGTRDAGLSLLAPAVSPGGGGGGDSWHAVHGFLLCRSPPAPRPPESPRIATTQPLALHWLRHLLRA